MVHHVSPKENGINLFQKLVPAAVNTEGEQERNDRGIQRAVNCLFVILEMESKEANCRERADSM